MSDTERTEEDLFASAVKEAREKGQLGDQPEPSPAPRQADPPAPEPEPSKSAASEGVIAASLSTRGCSLGASRAKPCPERAGFHGAQGPSGTEPFDLRGLGLCSSGTKFRPVRSELAAPAG